MTTALSGEASQVVALAAVSQNTNTDVRSPQVVVLVAYAPPSARKAATAEITGLVTTLAEGKTVPGTTQVVMLVAYDTGVPDQARSRAWTFTLDGHKFYVLNLGQEGTFVYDTTTQQWSQFSTQGFDQWNMLNGTMWDKRIVAGDSVNSYVWELNPDAVLDEGWRDIAHVVTGGVQTRSRVFISVEALRVTASVGKIDEANGATLDMRYSDDNGNTWSDVWSIALTEGDYSDEIAYRSLGSFMAPGRIFQLSDSGGLIRIDGADLFAENFDDEQSQGQ